MLARKPEFEESPIVIDLEGPQGNAFYVLGVFRDVYRQLLNADALPLDFPKWEEIQEKMFKLSYYEIIAYIDNTQPFGSLICFLSNNEELWDAVLSKRDAKEG